MLTSQALKGVFVPVVTPLDHHRKLDAASLDGLVRRLVGKGVHGLIVNGTAGEPPLIESGEFETLIAIARQAIDETRPVPLIAGTYSNDEASIMQRIAQAKALGADASLVAAPCGAHPSKYGLIRHFQALSGAELPLVLSDTAPYGETCMDLDTLQAIMKMDHIIGLKKSTGNLRHVFQLSRSIPRPILCGEDELFFASLCCGAQGGVVASANLDSDQFVRVYEWFREGKIKESHQAFDQLLPLIEFLLSEPSPAPIKWLLAQRGHIRCDRIRLPVPDAGNISFQPGLSKKNLRGHVCLK